MKRIRPVASLIRGALPVELVRLGGGWDGEWSRFAKRDLYRAQTSRFKGSAELTRCAFLLEALPASKVRMLVFAARETDPIALGWIDKLRVTAERIGLECEVEAIPGSGLATLAVRNVGGKARKAPHDYDRILAKRDERIRRRRERSGAPDRRAEAIAERDYWTGEAEKEAARWAKEASDPAIPFGDDCEVPF